MNIRPSNLLQGDTLGRLPSRLRARDRRLPAALVVVGLLILGFVAWRMLGSSSPQPGITPPPPVRVGLAQEKNVTGYTHSIGTVVSLATVQVTSLVTGQLLSAAFSEGQIVHAGQLLFQIDPRPFAAALDQAKATLARDQATATNAQQDLVRYTNLAAQGAATGQQRDTAIATAKAAAATVLADRAAVQTAQLNLGYTKIVSPITGKTGPILIQPGNLVTANNTASPLITLTQLEPIRVSMFLPQSDLPLIQEQMAAHRLLMTVSPNGGAAAAPAAQINGGTPPVTAPRPGAIDSLLTAPVNFVGNQVDPKTGTVELRATFPNTDFRLVPGQLLDAAVSLSSFPNAIVVPRDAVNTGPESRYVFVVVAAENRAEMRPVTVLNDDGVNAVVQGAVKPGDRVVVEGQLRVIPGKSVQVLASRPHSASGLAGP